MIRTFKEVPCKACNGTGRIKQENDLFSSYSGVDAGKLAQEICLGCNGMGIQSLLVGELETSKEGDKEILK